MSYIQTEHFQELSKAFIHLVLIFPNVFRKDKNAHINYATKSIKVAKQYEKCNIIR